MLTIKQVKQLKKHSKEAVESLPNDHPWIHFLGSLDALCDTALKLYAAMTKNEVTELQELFDSILCLAVEGPEVCSKPKLLEAIRKEAITGYTLCKDHLSGKSQPDNAADERVSNDSETEAGINFIMDTDFGGE